MSPNRRQQHHEQKDMAFAFTQKGLLLLLLQLCQSRGPAGQPCAQTLSGWHPQQLWPHGEQT
jgi:hypothetical protein